MTRRINDDDLLAFIEGELTGEDAQRVRAELAGDDALRAMVEGARRDRLDLRAWGRATEARAPADLVEQAMRQGERAALLDDPPALRRSGRMRFVRRSALAASLMVSVGVGILLTVPLWEKALRQDEGTAIAMAPAPGAARDSAADMRRMDDGAGAWARQSAPAAAAPPEALADASVALREPEASESVAGRALASGPMLETGADEMLGEADAAPVRAIASEQAKQDTVISLTEAARLAGQRRLGVLASAAEPEAAADALSAALLTGGADTPVRTWAGRPDDDGVIRLVVALPAEQAWVRKTLDALGRSGVGSFRIVALEQAIAPAHAGDARDIFWWTQRSDRWARQREGAMQIELRPEAGGQ